MELLIIFLLTVLNGVLSMSEMAVVSARRTRLEQQKAEGSKNAVAALMLIENPNRFLSTVQIGITLIGILAGAFGGATLSDDAAELIGQIEPLRPYRDVLGVVLIVSITTYLSLVIGELVPKRIAIQSPERIAMIAAPVMNLLSRLAYPLVWVLSVSTEGLLRVLQIHTTDDPEVTEEEIHLMLAQGTRAGIFDPAEQEMVAGVFRLDDLRAYSLMTPRTEMTWLDINDPIEETLHKIMESNHSRYPVCEESPDNLLGVIKERDVLRKNFRGEPLDLLTMLEPPVLVPESAPVSDVLERFRREAKRFAMVISEHGGVEGIITVNDVIEAIVGDVETPDAVQREDGSWLIDGQMPFKEFKALVDFEDLPEEEDRLFGTLAGFFMTRAGKIPKVADHFEDHGFYFEVVDMDGHRVDKILVKQLHSGNGPDSEPA